MEVCVIIGVDMLLCVFIVLSNGYMCIVIKCGSDGCFLYDDDGQLVMVLVFLVEVLDSIGVGDFFDVGFLYVWCCGLVLFECLCWVSVCGVLFM